MSNKPENISQEIWDAARRYFDDAADSETGNPHWCQMRQEDIARVIIADRADIKSRIDLFLNAAMDKTADNIFDVVFAVQAEREACARIADDMKPEPGDIVSPDWYYGAACVATAIRSRP